MPILRPPMDRARRLLSIPLRAFLGLTSLMLSAGTGRATRPCAQPLQLPAVPPEFQQQENTLSIVADSQEKDKDVFHLRGHVQVTLEDSKLTADEATYDAASGEMTAKGHVTFTDPDSNLMADEAEYNLRAVRGRFFNVHGYVHTTVRPRSRMLVTENPFYLRAKRVERVDAFTYVVDSGRLTSCEREAKGWSLATSHARVKLGDKVVARSDVFRFLRVPVFFSPVFVNSIARKPRQTGILLPHFGNSSQKGVILGDGFFWAINPSADLMLGLENYSIRGLARSARLRARPSSASELRVEYFGVNDRGSGALRQFRAPGDSLRAVGQAKDVGYGFRGVVDVDYITSLAFRQTFSDNFTQAVTSELRQTGFLTKNFDAYSLNFYVSRYQNFLCAQRALPGTTGTGTQGCPVATANSGTLGNSISIRQTPTFSLSGMDKQVGHTPLFFAFDASAGAFGRAEPAFQTPRFSERFDFHPALTLRTRPLWGFHFTPSAGLRATRYGTSLRSDGGPLSRFLGEASLDLRPPSLEKVFGRTFLGYRVKHVIEPEIRYRLVRAEDARDLRDVIRFDETDILAETNEVEYSLVNSFLMRKETADASGEKPQARELVSLRLTEKYYFDPTFGGVLDLEKGLRVFEPGISLTGFAFTRARRLSPVVTVLKFEPFSSYRTELRADFSPNGGGVLNAGITSSVHSGPFGLAFTDFFINRTAALPTPLALAASAATTPSFHLLRAVATYGDVNRKGLSSALGVDYNFAQGIAHQVVSQVSYNFGCFGLDFEYRRFALGALRRENVFRMALSFANIGTFGNLKPRERLY